MTTDDYGKWSLFYTFILISNSFSASPVMAIFSRKFFSQHKDQQLMFVYFYKLVLLLQVLSLAVYYIFFSPLTWNVLLEVPALACMNLYAYLALFFRFKDWDISYMWHSFLRLGIFAPVLVLSILLFGKVSYSLLIGTFIICHIPSFLKTFHYLALPDGSGKEDMKEFLHLSMYGLSTSLVNGVDRFIIIASGFSLTFLGYYSFLYTLTNTPTIIVEALKKTMNPIIYRELSHAGKLSARTTRHIILISGALLVIQMTVPPMAYCILQYLNLINKEFILPDAYKYIYILSIGFFFQGVYHFVNPYYLYFKKSSQLLAIQLVCMGGYFIVLKYLLGRAGYEEFMWVKTGLLTAITVLCIVIKGKNNDNRLI